MKGEGQGTARRHQRQVDGKQHPLQRPAPGGKPHGHPSGQEAQGAEDANGAVIPALRLTQLHRPLVRQGDAGIPGGLPQHAPQQSPQQPGLQAEQPRSHQGRSQRPGQHPAAPAGAVRPAAQQGQHRHRRQRGQSVEPAQLPSLEPQAVLQIDIQVGGHTGLGGKIAEIIAPRQGDSSCSHVLIRSHPPQQPSGRGTLPLYPALQRSAPAPIRRISALPSGRKPGRSPLGQSLTGAYCWYIWSWPG